MKYSFNYKTFTAILTIFLFASCNKNDKHPKYFEAKYKTWYRVSPTTPVPVVVDGKTYYGFAYFPGGGTGHATHLGNSTIYFNQLTYGSDPKAPPVGSVSAPVSDVPGYPVLGGPLPLIQKGDFNQLSSAISAYHIPAKIHKQIINTVLYNDKGDAIFISATGGSSTFPISETVVGFKGKAIINSGRGKFKQAMGEVDFNGFFNVVNPNDAEYDLKGWIEY